MAKHREPDPEPLKRGSKRPDGGTADALRKASDLPDLYSLVNSQLVETALDILATDLRLPVEVVRAQFDKLREG